MPHIAQHNPLTANASDSTPNRPSTTDTKSVILSLEQLQAWIDQLSARLLSLKSVQVNSDRLALMMLDLHRRGYTQDQARKAECWIIYGDWKYRGTSPTIEIGDFDPSPEQIKSVQDRLSNDLVVMERSRVKAIGEAEYRRGKADGIAEERNRAEEKKGIAEMEKKWRESHD